MKYANKICLNQDQKVLLLFYYFIIFLGIAFIRSLGAADIIFIGGVAITNQIISIGLYIFILAPLIWIVAFPLSAFYLLGASPALGMLPEFPGLPFLREFSHLMVFVILIAVYKARSKVVFTYLLANKSLLAFASFLVVSLIGVIFNFFLYGSLWQLKLGVSGLIIAVAYLVMLILLKDGGIVEKMAFDRMLEGFIHSALILAGIGFIVTALLFLIPYSTGTNGIGNDTIYGLGYYDRMQLLFPGPVYAGIYFVTAMGLVIYRLVIEKKVARIFIFFLLIAPWLIMATGSRSAKLALILMLLVCLINPSSRKITIYTLPSALAALVIGFYFQSLPRAMIYFIGQIQDSHPFLIGFLGIAKVDPVMLEWMSMRGKFFQDAERYSLIKNSLEFFFNSSILQKLLGNGLGTAGFTTSEIPSPHFTFLNLIVETGLIGATLYNLWLYQLVSGLWRVRTDLKKMYNTSLLLLTTCFACQIIFSLTYEISTLGSMLVMLAMLFAFPLSFNSITPSLANNRIHNVSS